jgi:electron transport complex protein RnfE
LHPSFIKNYKRTHKYVKSLLIKNPALVLGFDLPFLIAATTSLKNAAAMSIEIFMIHMITIMLMVIFARKLEVWQRAAVTAVTSTAVMMLARELVTLIFPDIRNSLGIYMSLMAVNGLTLYQSLSLDKNSRPFPVLSREIVHVAGFVVSAFLLSTFREYFGEGMLWSNSVSVPFKLSGAMIPFSGFILMGFLLALIRFCNKRLVGLTIREEYRRESRYILITK